MSDTISRQAAIDAMANAIWHYPNECYQNLNAYEFAKSLAEFGLKDLPSAERPAGEWIKDEFGITVCSECKRPRRDSRVDHINFCNSCGARMINTK